MSTKTKQKNQVLVSIKLGVTVPQVKELSFIDVVLSPQQAESLQKALASGEIAGLESSLRYAITNWADENQPDEDDY